MSSVPISQALWNQLMSPGVMWLGIGLSGTSCFAWGNISALYVGVAPAITNGIKENDLSISKAVELFAWMYDRGKIYFPAAIAVSVVGFAGAALSLEEVRPLLTAAIIFQVAAGAWTPLAMMPTNNRLLLLRDQIREARAARKVNGQDAQIEGYDPLGDVQQAEAIQLLGKWKCLHRFRVVTGMIAWVLGIAALSLV